MKTALPNYSVRHSSKAKNLRLKVTRKEGLLVVVPRGYDENKIPSLLKQKKIWIADALARVGETRRFLEPESALHLPQAIHLVALGEKWAITYCQDKSHVGIRLNAEDGRLLVTGSELSSDRVISKLRGWLRLKVREGLFPMVEKLATNHRLNVRALLVKSQRTRWASCSARRNIALNVKLLFLSPDLVRYAVLHELCHTIHMNHSKEFWRLVLSCEPRYKVLDRSLRDAWKYLPQWVF